MDIEKALQATPHQAPHQPRRPEHPTGREFEWNGTHGFIRTEPLTERPRTWDEFITDAGLDPDEVEVIEPVNVRGWDAPVASAQGGGVVRMHYYRLNVRRRNLRVDIDDLIKAARTRRKPPPSTPDGEGQVFITALGDLQLGKMDGDGVEGTVQRFLDTTQRAVDRYKQLRRRTPISGVALVHLGDCIEGFVSQGGANAWRTTLTTTEQVRLYRRLLVEQIKVFAAVAPELTVVGVPGNHDEAHRPLHTYGDSWAIDAMSAVGDALDLAGGYDHVTVLAPARDELTVTLNLAGTIVGAAHGHQFGRGATGWKTWWQAQGHGRQPIGDADLLLAGHFHHLHVNQSGPRTFIQVPALESESTWWRHTHGEGGSPGIVTLLAGGGAWSGLEVL